MSEPIDDTKRPQYELREDGEIHLNKKGKSTLLAKYEEETGILTFESFAVDQKYRVPICRAVMEDIAGELTGNAIKAYAIAGRPYDKVRPGEPPPPKKNKMLGDKTPDYVKWLFKWRPQAAYARYGVLLDSNGDPRTAHCHRTEQGLLVPLPENGKPTQIVGDGKDALSSVYTEKEDGILALRQTCMTFTTKEVVGASGDEDEEDSEEPINAGASSAEDDGEPVVSAPKAKRGPKAKVTAEEAD